MASAHPRKMRPCSARSGQALRGGQGQQGVGMRLGGRHVSAALADEAHKAFRIRQPGEMLPLPGQGQRLLTPLLGLVGIA